MLKQIFSSNQTVAGVEGLIKQYTEKYKFQFFHRTAVKMCLVLLVKVADQVQEVQQYSILANVFASKIFLYTNPYVLHFLKRDFASDR